MNVWIIGIALGVGCFALCFLIWSLIRLYVTGKLL